MSGAVVVHLAAVTATEQTLLLAAAVLALAIPIGIVWLSSYTICTSLYGGPIVLTLCITCGMISGVSFAGALVGGYGFAWYWYLILPLLSGGAVGSLYARYRFPALLKALSDSDEDIRWYAVARIWRAGGQLAVEPLIKVLSDDKPRVVAAAACLGMLRDGRAIDPLIGALAGGDAEVCQAAAESLVQLRDTDGADPLASAGRKEELSQARQVIDAELARQPHDQEALTLKAWLSALLADRQYLTLPLPGHEKTNFLPGHGTMKFVRIEAGTFTMGSRPAEKDRKDNEGSQHTVEISTPFYMGVTEVTQSQWTMVMETQPWAGAPWAEMRPDNAASYINWDNATAFCAELSKRIGRIVRLPTEAEWEYACRAGTTTRFYYGDDPDLSRLSLYAWYTPWSIALDERERHAHPVGTKKPNPWGLYDMHGNVKELCADWYARSYANADVRDPKGPATGTARVIRGGEVWGYGSDFCRAAARDEAPHSDYFSNGRSFDIGFRVVVETGPDEDLP